jgi:hypothetical protein
MIEVRQGYVVTEIMQVVQKKAYLEKHSFHIECYVKNYECIMETILLYKNPPISNIYNSSSIV